MPKLLYEKYNFRLPIHRVLKQVHPYTKITQESMNEINLIIHEIIEKISQTMNTFDQKTTSSRTVQTAVRLCLPGELARHAIHEGTKAVTRYVSSKLSTPGTKQDKMSRSSRAGLQFPIGRVEHLMRHYIQHCGRLGAGAPVYLAAVLEYLTAEILELSGNSSLDHKRNRINTRNITLAIENDEELSTLLKDMTLSGGVLPNIHSALLPQK
jgi:histone H2A